MPAIQLFGLGIAAKSPVVTAKLMTNFYAEQRPAGEKSMLVAHGTPGLELFCDVESPARGALEFEKNSVAYVVAGATLWEIDGDGVKTNRGALLTTSSRVSMAHNGVQIMMVDGANGYIYNTVTLVFAQITDTDFPLSPTTVTYLSRRFICSFLDSSRFYVSAIDDGLSWDALDFANAEANPDPIIAVWASTGQLVLLGANTTEFWGNSGALDFPFVALQGSANEWGLAAVSSIAKYDNTFACLIKNRMGQVMVAQMNGYLPKKISTIDIDHIINSYVANEDAVGYSYMLGGHPFYVICFPSAAPAAPGTQSGGEGEEDNTPPVVEPPEEAETPVVPPDPRVVYVGTAATRAAGVNVPSAVDPVTGYVWTTSRTDLDPGIDTYVVDDPAQTTLAHIATAYAFSSILAFVYVPAGLTGREMWAMGWQFDDGDFAVVYNADTRAEIGIVVFGGLGHMTMAAYDPVTGKVVTMQATTLQVINPLTRAIESTSVIGSYGTAFCTEIIVTTDYLAVFTFGTLDRLTLLNLADYSVASVIEDPYAGGGGDSETGFAYDPGRERLIHMATAASGGYNIIEIATGTVTHHAPPTPAADADPNYSDDMAAVVYCAYNDRYIFAARFDGVGSTMTTLYLVNPETFETENTWTYENADPAHASLIVPSLMTPRGDPNYIFVLDNDRVKRYYLGAVPVPDPGPDPGPDDDIPPGHEPYPGRYAWRSRAPFDGMTWLYDGSTGFWSMLKSFEISRHRVEFSFQCAGQTIGCDYFNGKLYRITDTAFTDNGKMIEGEIIGETIALPDEASLTVNKLRVGMEVGVGNTVAPGENPQVSLSIARDSGAKEFGPEMWKPLGGTGEVHTRLEWRRLGTTRYFTPRIRITDAVKRVITGASVNPSD